MAEPRTRLAPPTGDADIVIRGGSVVDVATRRVEIRDVLIAGDRVVDIVNESQHRLKPGGRVIEASGCLVLPGLVNAHTHSVGTLARAVGANLPLEPYVMYAMATALGRTADEVRLSAQLQAIEAVRTGTTSLLDHLGGDVLLVGAAAEAYADMGIRAAVAPMVGDIPLPETVGLRLQDWPQEAQATFPKASAPSVPELIAANVELHKRWDGHDGRISVFFGPSAPQRCSSALLQAAAETAQRLDTGLHMHLLETRAQAQLEGRSTTGSVVRRLAGMGVLSSRVSTAHVAWAGEAEIELLASHGVVAVHNPQSNLQLGSGVAALPTWRRHGLATALGTDSVSCGGSLDLVMSMRLAAVLHRANVEDPADWETPWTVLEYATLGGARALRLPEVGQLAPGKMADVAIFEMAGTVYATAEDPVAAWVLGSIDHRARTVLVGGELVLDDGVLTTVDEAAITDAAADAHRWLMQRNKGLLDAARIQEPTLTGMSMQAHSITGRRGPWSSANT
ncbi:MAG: hypothetical protein JWR82_1982 [Blastococcus sp.]|nr:hypothetical protein [Blastococcus sp.]